MFTSFDDTSIGCQNFINIPVNVDEEDDKCSFCGTNSGSTGRKDESNGRSILSALKSLQDKLNRLEMERSELNNNMDSWNNDKDLYKNLSTSQQLDSVNFKKAPNLSVSPINQNKSDRNSDKKKVSAEKYSSPSRLDEILFSLSNRDQSLPDLPLNESITLPKQHSANNSLRYHLLEKQLEDMKKKVCEAEKKSMDATVKQIELEHEKGKIKYQNKEIIAKMDHLNNLETDYKQLALTNQAYLEKLNALEEELKHEKHQRQLIQDKAIQLESQATAQKFLCSNEKKSLNNFRQKNEPILSTKLVGKDKDENLSNKETDSSHYRLNLADLPFLTGTSTSPSHAFSANIQKIFHDLKHHNSHLCSKPGSSKNNKKQQKSSSLKTTNAKESWEKKFALEELTKDEEGLVLIIQALQNDFDKLIDEHRIFKKQLTKTADLDAQNFIVEQIKDVEAKMEEKGYMINMLKHHQQQLNEMVKKSQLYLAINDSSNKRPNKVGNKSKAKKPGAIAKQRQSLLRDVKIFHKVLKKDDLSWEL